MANLAGPPPTQPVPEQPRQYTPVPAPSFYLTGRQPLSPAAILLAIVAAVVALSAILYVMSHAMANRSAGQNEADDPDQVDVIVIGEAGHAAAQGHHDAHVSAVHPTILVHLPRFGNQVGFLPNTAAGHLLYDWLAAFNQASYPALADALPNRALAPATAAQLQLRRQTGGLSLLSAKEVEPGLLVFRMRDQTPAATEFLGTLLVRPNASPASIASFSLHALPAAPLTTPPNHAASGAR